MSAPLFLHYDFLEDLETPDHDAFRALDGIGCGPASALIAIIHGDADDVVPVTDSLRFAEDNHLPIRIVKGADHRYKKPGELEQIIDFAAEIFPADHRYKKPGELEQIIDFSAEIFPAGAR